MNCINADNAQFWQRLAADSAAQRPDPGKRVRVTSGKHKDIEGVVVTHMRSRFASDRYVSDANRHLRDLVGREGFVVRIRPANGGEQFWMPAEKVEVMA